MAQNWAAFSMSASGWGCSVDVSNPSRYNLKAERSTDLDLVIPDKHLVIVLVDTNMPNSWGALRALTRTYSRLESRNRVAGQVH